MEKTFMHEEDIRRELQKIKKEYKSYGVFIYECQTCKAFLLLNMEVCERCGCKNYFHQEDIIVNKAA